MQHNVIQTMAQDCVAPKAMEKTHKRSSSLPTKRLEPAKCFGRCWQADIIEPSKADLALTIFPPIEARISHFESQNTSSETKALCAKDIRKGSLSEVSQTSTLPSALIEHSEEIKIQSIANGAGLVESKSAKENDSEEKLKSLRCRKVDQKNIENGYKHYLNPLLVDGPVCIFPGKKPRPILRRRNTDRNLVKLDREQEINIEQKRKKGQNPEIEFTMHEERRNLRLVFKSKYIIRKERLIKELEKIKTHSNRPSYETLSRRQIALFSSKKLFQEYAKKEVDDEKVFTFFQGLSSTGDLKEIAPQIIMQIMRLDNYFHLMCELLRRSADLCETNSLFRIDTCGFTLYISYLLINYDECFGKGTFDEIALKTVAHYLENEDREVSLNSYYFKMLEKFFTVNSEKIEMLKRSELRYVTLLNDYFVALLYELIQKDEKLSQQDEAVKLAIGSLFLRCLVPSMTEIGVELLKSSKEIYKKQAQSLKILAIDVQKSVNNIGQASECDQNAIISVASLFFCNSDNTKSSSEAFLKEILKLKGIN